ncbi:hypothetical protein AKG12_01365 [Agrobacterium sp. SUL3]|nr:hypothetical protein AKG12_01365 [Agrobacterium sp. SUL3]
MQDRGAGGRNKPVEGFPADHLEITHKDFQISGCFRAAVEALHEQLYLLAGQDDASVPIVGDQVAGFAQTL